jgi:hypothetical protein
MYPIYSTALENKHPGLAGSGNDVEILSEADTRPGLSPIERASMPLHESRN